MEWKETKHIGMERGGMEWNKNYISLFDYFMGSGQNAMSYHFFIYILSLL